MKSNDILWKAILEDLFEDFLRFFYPNAEDVFDFYKGFEYLDKELEQVFPPDADNYAPRYVDKLVRVFTRQPQKEQWILVHLEVQGYTDKNFAKRMFQYYYRILDKYDMPVTAFAIYTDTVKTFHPKYYRSNFLGTRVYYRFNTYKIIDQEDAELEASDKPFALAVRSAKLAIAGNSLNDQQLFEQAYSLAKSLLAKKIPKEKIRNVMNFLRYYLRFDNHEMFAKFEHEIAVLTEKKVTMGIEEFLLDNALQKGIEKGIVKGIEKGIEKGHREEKIATALKMKKNGFDIFLISNITGLSPDEINSI